MYQVKNFWTKFVNPIEKAHAEQVKKRRDGHGVVTNASSSQFDPATAQRQTVKVVKGISGKPPRNTPLIPGLIHELCYGYRSEFKMLQKRQILFKLVKVVQ